MWASEARPVAADRPVEQIARDSEGTSSRLGRVLRQRKIERRSERRRIGVQRGRFARSAVWNERDENSRVAASVTVRLFQPLRRQPSWPLSAAGSQAGILRMDGMWMNLPVMCVAGASFGCGRVAGTNLATSRVGAPGVKQLIWPHVSIECVSSSRSIGRCDASA